jgi:hypothetical protein
VYLQASKVVTFKILLDLIYYAGFGVASASWDATRLWSTPPCAIEFSGNLFIFGVI